MMKLKILSPEVGITVRKFLNPSHPLVSLKEIQAQSAFFMLPLQERKLIYETFVKSNFTAGQENHRSFAKAGEDLFALKIHPLKKLALRTASAVETVKSKLKPQKEPFPKILGTKAKDPNFENLKASYALQMLKNIIFM